MSRLLNTVVDKARGRLFTEKLKLIALASKRITFLVDITFWELAHAEFPVIRSRSNPSASGLGLWSPASVSPWSLNSLSAYRDTFIVLNSEEISPECFEYLNVFTEQAPIFSIPDPK